MTKRRHLTVPEIANVRSRCQQVGSFRGPQEVCSCPSSRFCWCASNLCGSLAQASAWPVFIFTRWPPCVHISPFSKDTSHTGLGLTLMTSSSLIISGAILFPNKVTFWGNGVQDFNIWICGSHDSTHNRNYKKIYACVSAYLWGGKKKWGGGS